MITIRDEIMQDISNGLLRISTIIRKSHIFHPIDAVIGGDLG